MGSKQAVLAKRDGIQVQTGDDDSTFTVSVTNPEISLPADTASIVASVDGVTDATFDKKAGQVTYRVSEDTDVAAVADAVVDAVSTTL